MIIINNNCYYYYLCYSIIIYTEQRITLKIPMKSTQGECPLI